MDGRDLILDQYAPLSHKRGMGDTSLILAPTWVPARHMRRLAAYRLLHAYMSNVARHFFTGDDESNADMVEYGDPALLVERIAAAVLGDDPSIVVDGADVDDLPSIGDPPDEPADDATDLERRIAEVRRARWERDATAIIDAWVAAVDAQPALAERERWLRATLEADGAVVKVRQAVGHAVGLGDGVLVVGWDDDNGRPSVEVFEPGFHFDSTDPDTVHLAWTEEETSDGGTVEYVRRITYWLAPADDGSEVTYPWRDTPSAVRCWRKEGRWRVNDVRTRDDFLDDNAVELTVTDEGVDFLPVVHLPGIDIGATYGASVLAKVAQLLDEIIATDTDVSKAQSFAAGPAIALSGSTLKDSTVEPGVVYNIDGEGRMTVLDLSAGLAEVRLARADLLERLSVNSSVPPEVLGRVTGTVELSGVAIALRFGPFASLTTALRSWMLPALSDLLTMWQRYGQANGVLESGATPVARVAAGQFLPSDRAALVGEVTSLLDAGAVSPETAVHLLVAGGLSIPDASGEVARIRAADTAGAKNVAEALASEAAAARYLGVPAPEPAPAEGTLGGQ